MKLNNLKNLRKNLKITQKELAKELSITRSAYNHYELGNYEPDIKTLIKLANYFNVSVDYIVGHQTKNQLQLGYLNEDKKNAIKKLIVLNQINFIKAYSYISGLHAAQN